MKRSLQVTDTQARERVFIASAMKPKIASVSNVTFQSFDFFKIKSKLFVQVPSVT